MLFTQEMMTLLLLSYFAGSHHSVLRSCAGSPSRPMPALGDEELCGSGTATPSTNPFMGILHPPQFACLMALFGSPMSGWEVAVPQVG